MYYCDGTTYKNGQVGQDSSFIVLNTENNEEIREHLGDFTINYAELSAIIRAFEICELGAEIRSDSNICVGWIHNYKRTKKNKYLEEKIRYAQDLYHTKGLSLKYIPREHNLAGLSLEEKPIYI